MILNARVPGLARPGGGFDTPVKEIAAQHEKLTFKYTGPWPPYNFVNIRLKLERAESASFGSIPQCSCSTAS